MDTGVEVTRGELASALGWLVEAGVDTLVGDSAHDWLADVATLPPPVARPASKPAAAAPQLAAGVDSLETLAAAVEAFRAGSLIADGVATSGVMLVGDAPTPGDIATARVFADDAGALLDRMLASIGRDRTTAYLTNASYWADGCDATVWRERQLQLARPRAILALGGVATAALCGSSDGINRLRGRWQVARIGDLEIPVLPTFHPAYLLRQPAHKALAWADLCAFRARIDG